ncbi:nitroreductase family protein [Galenea microaerophila]
MTNQCLQIIRDRRTVHDFLPTPVSQTVLHNCLQAAIWAPNHKKTEPWRFWVIGPIAQQGLAEIYGQLRASKKYHMQEEPEAYQQAYDQAKQRFLAIPKIVLVGQQLTDDPVRRKEDYAACSCAIQNFQLAAWSQKLGVKWSTGLIIQHPETYAYLQIQPEKIELIGALYCGYPEKICSAKRKEVEEVTYFLD